MTSSDVISTGYPALNAALGVAGYPRGRIVEIFGPKASGKTSLALRAIAEAQRAGGAAALIDADHALDLSYAASLGVDVPALLLSQPDTAEQAFDFIDALVRCGALDLIVVDSATELMPRAELEGEVADLYAALHARLMSKALRTLACLCPHHGTTLLFTSTLAEPRAPVGPPRWINALKYYASVRLHVRPIPDSEAHGAWVKVTKNKFAPPFAEAELEVFEGEAFGGRLGTRHGTSPRTGVQDGDCRSPEVPGVPRAY